MEAAKRKIHQENSSIRYLSSDALNGPLDVSKDDVPKSFILVIVAAVIGAYFLFVVLDSVLNASAREEAAIQEALSVSVDMQLPVVSSYALMSDADVVNTMAANGLNIIEISPVAEGNPLDVIKLPDGYSSIDAAALYAIGLNKASASELVKILNGAWTLDATHDSGVNMSLHYVDFSAASEDAAIQTVLTSQGIAQESVAESGVDDSGNTYASGSMTIGDGIYSWKASCLPISEVYEQSNLPTSYYVGFRIYS